ncbi:MAG: hypothetical protein IPH23_09060 [Gammaproteobacteria bacterium]|nr:hypothetical protein [Gammaproteobacteria bacterium]
MALEHAAEEKHAHHVLYAANDVHEAIGGMAALGLEGGFDAVIAGSEDVKADRQIEIDGALPERVVPG